MCLSKRPVLALFFFLLSGSLFQAHAQPDSFDTADSLFFAGMNHAANHQYHEAIAAYKWSIALKPKLALAYNNLGAAYCAVEQWDDAVVAYQKALQLNVRSADIYNFGISLWENTIALLS